MSRICSFLALICCAVSLACPAAAAQQGAGPVFDWPQLLRDPKHSSYDPDRRLTATNAPTLGLNWMSAMRSADLGSPVINYNVSLKKTVAYIGDERGDVTAYDESNGTTLWSTSVGFGDSMRSSPLVDPDGAVWVATAYGSTLYKLDGNTGAVVCSVKEPIRFNASPMIARPPGGVPTIFIATNDVGTMSGPTVAIRVSDCATLWTFTNYITYAGAWATAAYAVDANGKGRVYLGTADPDSTMYALDANTGALVWHFTPNIPPGDWDIGAAATISPPGTNGFANGALYFPDKYGIFYAVDLTTGAPLWQTTFDQPPQGLPSTGRSSAALLRSTLVFGMSDGIDALDAKTGNLIWHYSEPSKTEVISSPAIVGPTNAEIVVFGDTAGAVHAVRLSDGKDLYDYQTGNYITSSPAIVNGHILIDSSDGFLYDFTAKGGKAKGGTTAIVSPANGSSVPNPKGLLTVTGTADDAAGLTELQVAVQAGGPTGPWYDGATGTFIAGAYNNFVPVKSFNSKHSKWSFQFPVPPSGQSYTVFANAVDIQGQVDRKGAQSAFSVKPNASLPQLKLSDGRVVPGSTFTVNGTGFAPNEVVAFTLQSVPVGQTTANASGAFNNVTITVPAKAVFGPSALVATGQTSQKTTTATVDISNIWSQFGYDGTRAAFAPNDEVLSKTLEATGTGYVSRAWYYSTGAPVNSSPAVVAGSAYVGNDAGTLSSIDTASGAPFWTYTTPAKKAIHASPAVDHGLVVFGADDGALYTLATSNGTLIGTFPLDGIPTAPAIVTHVIYVATDNGSVYAIDDATGKLAWKTAVGAAVHVPVAVDSANGLVIVGDDGGTISELNATTGTIVRHATVGATITAAPIVSAGTLYVASSDGNLRLLTETSLATQWQFSAGSPIRASAVTATGAYAGADNGTLYDLSKKTGKVIYQLAFGAGKVVGIGSTLDVPFIETASGDVGASKDDQQRILYSYQTGGTLSTSPAIVDGAVFIGAGDGGLYAFTPYGNSPQNARERLFERDYRAQQRLPAHWAPAFAARGGSVLSRAFQPTGPRDFPLYLNRASDAAASAVVLHGGVQQHAPRRFLVTWSPRGMASLGAMTAGLTGFATDTAPYPNRIDDAAVQREIARTIAAHRWNVDVNSQIVVVAPGVSASQTGYCAYHSAFHPGGAVGAYAVYAFAPMPDRASGCASLPATLQRLQTQMQTDPLLDGSHDALGRER